MSRRHKPIPLDRKATGALQPVAAEGLNPFLMAVASKTPTHLITGLLETLRASGGDEAVAAVINTPADDTTRSGGYYPLHYACQLGDWRMVELLLSNGADVNTVKNNGSGALMCAVFSCGCLGGLMGVHAHNPDSKIDSYGRPRENAEDFERCVRLVMEHPNFDLDSNDMTAGDAANSPVWCAVGQSYDEKDKLLRLLRLFLARGFDPDACIHGQPALHMAVRNSHTECAKALIMAGADTTTTAPNDMQGFILGRPTEQVTAIELLRVDAREEYADIGHGKYCNKLADELASVARTALAVSGRKDRHHRLRSANANGSTNSELMKRAQKAETTAFELMKVERWDDVVVAFEESIAHYDNIEGATSLIQAQIDDSVALGLQNMTSAHMSRRREKAALTSARQFTRRFPEHPFGWYLIALILNNKRAECTFDTYTKDRDKVNDDAVIIAEAAEAIKKSYLYLDVLRRPSANKTGWPSADRIKKALDMFRKQLTPMKPRTPATQMALDAVAEFNGPVGVPDLTETVATITRAIEQGCDQPGGMVGIRGSMRYQLAKNILDGITPVASTWSADQVLANCGPQSKSSVVRATLELAFVDFTKSAMAVDVQKYRWLDERAKDQVWLGQLNCGLAKIALGSFSEAEQQCVLALQRLNKDKLRRSLQMEKARTLRDADGKGCSVDTGPPEIATVSGIVRHIYGPFYST